MFYRAGSITEHQDVVRNTSRVLKDLKLNTNYSVTIRAFSEVASDPSEPIIIRTGEESEWWGCNMDCDWWKSIG